MCSLQSLRLSQHMARSKAMTCLQFSEHCTIGLILHIGQSLRQYDQSRQRARERDYPCQ